MGDMIELDGVTSASIANGAFADLEIKTDQPDQIILMLELDIDLAAVDVDLEVYKDGPGDKLLYQQVNITDLRFVVFPNIPYHSDGGRIYIRVHNNSGAARIATVVATVEAKA